MRNIMHVILIMCLVLTTQAVNAEGLSPENAAEAILESVALDVEATQQASSTESTETAAVVTEEEALPSPEVMTVSAVPVEVADASPGRTAPTDDKAKAAAATLAKLSVGNWTEYNTGRFDYTQYITIIDVKDLQARFDVFDKKNLRRFWFNYGKLPIVKGKDFNVTYSPGIILNNKRQIYYGGFVIIKAPGIGFDVVQKSYAGNQSDYHQTFANLRLFKAGIVTCTAQYYMLMKHKYTPDAYIGPKVNVGEYFTVYYGISPNRPGAHLVNTFVHFKF